MATYDLEEQEQLDELKAWWKQYGNLVTGVLLALSMAVAAWQGWNWYQRQQSAQASAVFNVLQLALSQQDAQKVKVATGELLEKYSRSEYASMAAMLAGKSAFEAGDLKTAKVQFTWAMEHASDRLRDLSVLRLATTLAEEKSFEEALNLLSKNSTRYFEPLFIDARGDILLAQGKRSEARAAYQLALTKKSEISGSAKDEMRSTGFRNLVQQKIDSLGDA